MLRARALLLAASLLACSHRSARREVLGARAIVEPLRAIPALAEALATDRQLSPRLPRLAADSARLLVDERVWIEVTTSGATGAYDDVDGARVLPSALPATDVVWTALGNRIEELRVQRSSDAPQIARSHVRFGEGIADARARDGGIDLVDRSGATRFVSPRPFAIDARGVRRDATMSFSRARDGIDVEVTLDREGLSYPIVLDPAWTATATMLKARSEVIAVTMADGRVLVGGGMQGFGTCASGAEVFNPTTNTFSSISGGGGCGTHLALLPNNKVLRAGGAIDPGISSGAALYDATTGWTATGTMAYVRSYGAMAELPPNEVIITGGAQFATSCEIYSISAGTWSLCAAMPVGRSRHTATRLPDGTVLVVGGDGPLASAARYTRSSNSWAATGSMSVARTEHTATLLSTGRVLVVGGGTSVAELFNPATGTFGLARPLSVARTGHTATLLSNGRVLVAGGGGTSAEIYDPLTDTWTNGGAMTTARVEPGAAKLVDGRVLVMGGRVSGSGTGDTPSTETWGQLLGAACAASYECVSGSCVDGVCCSTASCPTGFSCNVAGKLGTCAKPLGGACTSATDCASGFCADGVCCNSACTAQCAACNLSGRVGLCSASAGAPVGARTACGGAGAGTSCGARCDGFDTSKCTFPGSTTACGALSCASGVETRPGACNGAGACATTTQPCGVYRCGVASCLTSCTTSTDCVSGHFCKGSVCTAVEGLGKPCTSPADCATGFCSDGVCCAEASCGVTGSCALPGSEGTCKTKQGETCATSAACATGHCVDGRCCDRACDGQCEACDAEGREGVCSPIGGAPHGSRAKCDDGGTNKCAARSCNGAVDAKSCVGYATDKGVECAEPRCDGGKWIGPSSCDGAGACASPAETSCVPFGCAKEGCRKTCSSDAECADKHVCRGSRCEPAAAECSIDLVASIGADGVRSECAPYFCQPDGTCGKSCKVSTDCTAGNVCDVATGSCGAPPAVEPEDGGGCTTSRARGGNAGFLMTLLLGALVATRRRAWMLAALGLFGCRREQFDPSARVEPLRPFLHGVRTLERAPNVDARLLDNNTLHVASPSDPAFYLDVRSEAARAPTPIEREGAWLALDADEQTDLAWVATDEGVEDLRVLRGERAPTTIRYHLTRGPAVERIAVREGRIEAWSRAGRVELGSAPIVLVDARGERRAPSVRVEGDDVVVELDLRGLAFPVVLDPAWTTRASMAVVRTGASAARLSDGRVLVTGGYQAGASNSAELFDPATNTWSMAPTPKSTHGMLLDDYQIMPSQAVVLPSGKILVDGEVFDRTTNTWTLPATAPGVAPRAIGLLGNGTVLGACTEAPSSFSVRDANVYDPATNSWSATTPTLGVRRHCAIVGLNDGRGLLVSGTSEVYAPTTKTWASTTGFASMGIGVVAVKLPSGKVLATGGSASQLFDPATNTWTAVSGGAASWASAALLPNGKVLVAGGYTTAAQLFDPATSTWSTAGAMGTVRGHAAGALLNDGRVLVAGGATSRTGATPPFYNGIAGAETFGETLGNACAASWECASGSCVDGVCCATSSCTTPARCDLAPRKGSCTRPIASTCATGGDCASGFCVDGVCCDGACTGQCEACDVVGRVGTCWAVSGAPHGTRSICGAPTGDPQCGNRCDGSDRAKCNLPGVGSSCSADACIGGIETRASTCDGAGKCTDTSKACSPYACGPAACKTGCTANTDCAKGFYCKDSACTAVEGLGNPCTSSATCATGFCTDGVCCGEALCAVGSSCATPEKKGTCAKKRAAPCANAAECASGQCVDGVCCDRACDGQCEACDVAGSVGTCVGVAGAPHGSRAPCSDGAGDACAARTCDGARDAKTCAGFAASATFVCKPGACSGSSFTGPSTCADGTCGAPAAVECAPYRCDDLGCRAACSRAEHCADGNTCVDQRCVPLVATCSSDRLSSTAKDGSLTQCSPYRCTTAGTCGTTCSTSNDCAPLAACDPNSKTCVAAAATESDGGCAMGRARSSSFLALLFALGLLARRRR